MLKRFVPSLALVGIVVWLSINQQPIVGAIVVAIACARKWFIGRSGEGSDWLKVTPFLIGGMSFLVIIALHTNLAVQIILGAAFWLFWVWLAESASSKGVLAIAAVNQLLLCSAVFLAASLWQWPSGAVVGIMWAGSFLIADRVFEYSKERARLVMSASWALVVAELSWVFELWQVNYILPGGWLAIPQAAIVIIALAYSLGSIYLAHTLSHLSRRRLAEYIVISMVVIVIVLSGTKWNGVI